MKKLTSVLLAIILGTMSVVTVFAETPKEVKKEIREEVVKPRAGVITQYSETPVGSSADYTVFISSRQGNDTLKIGLGTIAVDTLAAIIAPHIGMTKLATELARAIIAGAGLWAGRNCLYYKEVIMGHESDSWAHRKKTLTYYYDENYTEYAGSKTVYINQYWY